MLDTSALENDPRITNPYYIAQSDGESLEIEYYRAQRYLPDLEPKNAADDLASLIKFYRVFNPEVAEMLCKAFLTLKNWE